MPFPVQPPGRWPSARTVHLHRPGTALCSLKRGMGCSGNRKHWTPSKDKTRCVLRARLTTGSWKSWLHQVMNVAITYLQVTKRGPLLARGELRPPAGQDPELEGRVGSCVQTRLRVPADQPLRFIQDVFVNFSPHDHNLPLVRVLNHILALYDFSPAC